MRNPDLFSTAVAREVGEHIAALGSIGWTLWDVAEAIDSSRTALISWRNNAADMPMRKMLKLRAVVAEHVGVRRTG